MGFFPSFSDGTLLPEEQAVRDALAVAAASKVDAYTKAQSDAKYALIGSGGGGASGPVFGPGTLRGNRIAVIGDSTARGTYFGDSEPGVKGDVGGATSTTLVPGMAWLTWAAQLSGGRIVRHKNAATIGDTIAGMNARVAVDVIPSRPDACIVVSGYNDAFNNVTTADYMTSFTAIHEKLHTAGIEMIAATPLSTANSGASFLAKLDGYSAAIRAYAVEHGLQVVDFATLRNADGSLPTNIATGGDGVHPGAAGQIILGRFVADAILPRLPKAASMPIAQVLGANGNMTPNRLFTGTVTDGKASSVSKIGAADATIVPTVTTAPYVEGNVQRITVTGTTADATFFQRVQQANQWDVGDLVAVSAKVTTTGGVDGSIRFEFNKAPYWNYGTRITENVTRATVYTELRITAADVTFFDLQMIVGAGTGYVEFGELAVYNLTKLGLA